MQKIYNLEKYEDLQVSQQGVHSDASDKAHVKKKGVGERSVQFAESGNPYCFHQWMVFGDSTTYLFSFQLRCNQTKEHGRAQAPAGVG